MVVLLLRVAGFTWEVIWRSLIVVGGCIGGLIVGALIYYIFFEDLISLSGSPSSQAAGKVLCGAAVVFFGVSVGLLYLDILPPVIVALGAMALTSLMWSVGVGMQEAGLMYSALSALQDEDHALRRYLTGVTKYRQIQELRRVARRMYVPGSPHLKRLEELIRESGHE